MHASPTPKSAAEDADDACRLRSGRPLRLPASARGARQAATPAATSRLPKLRLSAILIVLFEPLAMPARAAIPAEESLLRIAKDPQAGMVERTRAFADLRAVATEGAIPELVSLLSDPDWSFSARSVLEAMPGPVAARTLLDALDTTKDLRVRVGLVTSLGQRHHAAAVPALVKLLPSSDPALASAGINALGDMRTSQAGDALAAFSPPAALRTIWADALIRIAGELAPSEPRKTLALLRVVIDSGVYPQAAAAAIARARLSDNPPDAIAAALRSDQPAMRTAALSILRTGEFGAALTAAVAREFVSLPVGTQSQVLSALYDRGDRSAAPLARRALAAADPAVSSAAAKLLSVVGDASDAPALIAKMIGEEEPAPAARLALARLAGAEVAAQLLEQFRRGGDSRAAALEVLVHRGHRPLLRELLEPEPHADEAFARAAAPAILALGTAADLEAVLALHNSLPRDRRQPLQTALRRLAEKHPSPDEASRLAFVAAQKLPPPEAERLLIVMTAIGGDAALASLSSLLASDSSDWRAAALRAFGNWRDTRPVAALLNAARAEPDPRIRSIAIRSAIAVLSRSALGPNNQPVPELVPEAIAGLRAAWEIAAEPADKNAIIVALRGLKHDRAAEVARELETANAVK